MKCIEIDGTLVSFYYKDDTITIDIPLSQEDENAISFHLDKGKESGKLESYRKVNGSNIEVACYWKVNWED